MSHVWFHYYESTLIVAIYYSMHVTFWGLVPRSDPHSLHNERVLIDAMFQYLILSMQWMINFITDVSEELTNFNRPL